MQTAGTEGDRGRFLAGTGGNLCMDITAASIAGEPHVRIRAPARYSCQHLSTITRTRQEAAGICYLDSRNQTKGSPRLGPAVPSPPLTSAGSREMQGWPMHRAEQLPSQQPPFQSVGKPGPPLTNPPDKPQASCWDLDTSFATVPRVSCSV